MVRVALVGASGYTGVESLRLLLRHPNVEVTHLCAGKRAGEPMGSVAPAFAGLNLPTLVRFDADDVAAQSDFAFLALPHQTAQDAAAALLDRGVKVIDLSADHRFDDAEFYGRVYGPHAHPASLSKTVYGLPELNRERIRETQLVGCPGCYPTSVILATSPIQRSGLLVGSDIIADCKSGVSGAGRNPGTGNIFAETSEGMHAYKTLNHRHAPEMSRALGGIRVRFVPHLIPMNRGILSTVYVRLTPDVDFHRVRQIYQATYGDEPFVTILPEGHHPDPRNVRGTNRCHIGLFLDENLLVIQAAIDNLGKGAAGQALQCFNLMAGFAETTGLEQTALFP